MKRVERAKARKALSKESLDAAGEGENAMENVVEEDPSDSSDDDENDSDSSGEEEEEEEEDDEEGEDGEDGEEEHVNSKFAVTEDEEYSWILRKK